jgi:HEPN domain-containing protein
MKSWNMLKVLALTLVCLFAVTTILVGQEKKDEKKEEASLNPDGTYSSTKYNEAERPEDSYLAKFHAQDVVEKLMKKNLDQIYLLKVIVSNYKDKGWDGDYNKCYEGYKKAMELYYKRNIIYSRVEFENNKKEISDLLKKISEEYKKDTQVMLDDCANKILLLHLNERTRSDPNKNRELYDNQMRLRISYGQFDDAVSATIDKNYETAVYHYRVAKSYAIRVIEELSQPHETDGVKSKYQIHKADNLNRIFDINSAVKEKDGGSSSGGTTGK